MKITNNRQVGDRINENEPVAMYYCVYYCESTYFIVNKLRDRIKNADFEERGESNWSITLFYTLCIHINDLYHY